MDRPIPTGKIARLLFLGLLVAEFINLLSSTSTSFYLTLYRFHRAGHCFDFLLLCLLLFNLVALQGDGSIDNVQRWHSIYNQQYDHVVSTVPVSTSTKFSDRSHFTISIPFFFAKAEIVFSQLIYGFSHPQSIRLSVSRTTGQMLKATMNLSRLHIRWGTIPDRFTLIVY